MLLSGRKLWTVAAAAWLCALALIGFRWPVQQRELSALRDAAMQQAALVERRRQRSMTVVVPAVDPKQQFYAAFAPAEQRQLRLEALMATARSNGLQWQRSELRLSPETALKLVRYQVTLPLTGTYKAVRGAIEEALLADPGLSLDRLQLQRATPGGVTLEAETVWSLWMRAADNHSPVLSSEAAR